MSFDGSWIKIFIFQGGRSLTINRRFARALDSISIFRDFLYIALVRWNLVRWMKYADSVHNSKRIWGKELLSTEDIHREYISEPFLPSLELTPSRERLGKNNRSIRETFSVSEQFLDPNIVISAVDVHLIANTIHLRKKPQLTKPF